MLNVGKIIVPKNISIRPIGNAILSNAHLQEDLQLDSPWEICSSAIQTVFFCGHPDKYSGWKSSHKLIPIRTMDFQNSIKQICASRNDSWSETVLGRIECVNDLHAADAVYHLICTNNFRTGLQIPQILRWLSSRHCHGVPVPWLLVSLSRLSRVRGHLALHYCRGEAGCNEKDKDYLRTTCGYTLVTIWECERDPSAVAVVDGWVGTVGGSIPESQMPSSCLPAPGADTQVLLQAIHRTASSAWPRWISIHPRGWRTSSMTTAHLQVCRIVQGGCSPSRALCSRNPPPAQSWSRQADALRALRQQTVSRHDKKALLMDGGFTGLLACTVARLLMNALPSYMGGVASLVQGLTCHRHK